MKQLIDKSALVAEIERRIKEISKEFQESKYIQYTLLGKINALENLLTFLDTLEVKEVDLEKEYDNEFFKDPIFGKLVNRNAGISIAKHFFELGLKAQSKDMIEALRTEYEKGRADVIAKTIEWINAFNDNNYIMQYSDSCEHPINEILEQYENFINKK